MQRFKFMKLVKLPGQPKQKQTYRLPPRPVGHWLWGNLQEIKRHGRDYHLLLKKQLGEIYRVRVLNFTAWFVTEPALVEEVLVKQRANFNKGPSWEVMRKFSGNGLVTSDGDLWLRQRRMIQPAFHRECIEEYARLMTDFTHWMLNHKWATSVRQEQASLGGKEVLRDVYADMKELTLEIVCGALFDVDVGESKSMRAGLNNAQTSSLAVITDRSVGGIVGRAIEAFDAYTQQRFSPPDWLPTKRNRTLQSGLAEIDGLVYNLIAQRRNDSQLAERKDLLSLLVRMKDSKDGFVMSDKQLRDEVLTLLSAGHDTTAVALSWALYLVATHPDVQKQLLSELQILRASRQTSNPPSPNLSQIDIQIGGQVDEQPLELTVADLAHLKYHTQVVKETLRLYPSFWLTVRDTVTDTKIGGYDIKKGTRICVLPWVTHRDPRFFSDPEEFRPERWTSEFEQSLPRFAYFPFGGGARQCMGNAFAMQEAILVLATILSQYEVRPSGAEPVKPGRGVVVRPSKGLSLIIKPRDQPEFQSIKHNEENWKKHA
jgi:cytochrome P450